MTKTLGHRKFEDALIGKKHFVLKAPVYVRDKKSFVKGSFAESEADKNKEEFQERHALKVIRYAIEDFLGWSAQDAYDYLDEEIIDKLRLKDVLRYISYPKYLDPKKDFWWAIYRAFPEKINFDRKQYIIAMYEKIISGEIKTFPRNFFNDHEGNENLNIILHHFIMKNFLADSVDKLYEEFATEGIVKKIKDAQLKDAFKKFYRTPLEWLHDSLEDSGDSLLFRTYQYRAFYDKLVTGKGKGFAKKGRKRSVKKEVSDD